MSTHQLDLIVIGGGASGLSAAWILGQWRPSTHILVLEKARGWGGRMATRRQQDWIFDHGALRVESFGDYNRDLWALGRFNLPAGQAAFPPRLFSYAHSSSDGMTSWAKRSVAQLTPTTQTRLEAQVKKLDRKASQWIVSLDSGEEFVSTHLLITAPAPQARELLGFSSSSSTTWVNTPPEWRDRLLAEPRLTDPPRYAPCVTALLGFLGQPEPLRQAWAKLSAEWPEAMSWRWNDELGPSTRPALTLQMNEAWSRSHTQDTEGKPLAATAEATSEILAKLQGAGLQPDFFELKVWRYAYPTCSTTPAATARAPFLSLGQKLWLAGDAWAGSGVKASVLSGFMAARQIAEDLG